MTRDKLGCDRSTELMGWASTELAVCSYLVNTELVLSCH